MINGDEDRIGNRQLAIGNDSPFDHHHVAGDSAAREAELLAIW
jgi:hypothetical protein